MQKFSGVVEYGAEGRARRGPHVCARMPLLLRLAVAKIPRGGIGAGPARPKTSGNFA